MLPRVYLRPMLEPWPMSVYTYMSDSFTLSHAITLNHELLYLHIERLYLHVELLLLIAHY